MLEDNSSERSSAGYSITARLQIKNRPGCFAAIVQKLAESQASLAEVTLLTSDFDHTIRDLTINCKSEIHGNNLTKLLSSMQGVVLLGYQDDTYAIHDGGKLAITAKNSIKTTDELSRVYTPGVARICTEIANNKEAAFHYTIKKNSVAVISDGTAVLGLGDIGPEAAMPVMEGKAILFKQFAGIDGFPICLDTKDTEEIIRTVKYLSPSFGGINLEDISAPRCFEIERRLQEELNIPIFHDDQHGTAVVVLAGLINSLKIINKKIGDLKVVISGFGAGGVACAKILLEAGVRNIIPCDSVGIVYRGREKGMNPVKEELLKVTNLENIKGTIADAMKGADMFLGVSQPGAISVEMVRTMASDPIVFALANPTPEILPAEIEGIARIVATGRSDYANQVNNVLCFPGIFRGALDCHAREITMEMKIAAAYAIAECVEPNELCEDYIIPRIFKEGIAANVAQRVREVAIKSGVARTLSSVKRGLDKPHGRVGN